MQILSPEKMSVIPRDGDSKAESSKNNNTFVKLSYTFDFRALVDFSHLILLICYIGLFLF